MNGTSVSNMPATQAAVASKKAAATKAATPSDTGASSTAGPCIKVWDLPTRLFHWSLAASFVTAIATSESERWRDIHVNAGYAIAGLITFRVLWGFIGNRYARFAQFAPTPTALGRYINSLLAGKPEHHVGHNPAGALAIFALLLVGAGASATGWATYQEMGGHWMEEFHEGLGNGMMALVGIHLVGVVVSSLLHRENLLAAMITGWKTKAADADTAGRG